jgi:hypothetical protein
MAQRTDDGLPAHGEAPYLGGGIGGGGTGITEFGVTHDDRSNSMNSSASS